MYIKITNDMWIAGGFQKYTNQQNVTIIGTDRYIPYQMFKNIAEISQNPLHNLVKKQNIVFSADMKKIKKQAELTPQQKQQMQQLKFKRQMRSLDKYRPKAKYFQSQKDETIKDLSKSLSFGMTFIFSFFMAGLTGYYFGTYFMGLQFVQAMVVAVIFIMGTIIVQTGLFIIKQDRDDKINARKKQQNRQQIRKPKKVQVSPEVEEIFKEKQKLAKKNQ